MTTTRILQSLDLATGTMRFLVVQLLFMLCTKAIEAMHFPRPVTDGGRAAAERWESVHDFRKRLEIPFEYNPVALHPEDCRYKTEQECQAADMIKLEYVEKQRRRAQEGSVSDRPAAAATEDPEENVLVLLMRFTDHADRVLPKLARFKTLWEVKIAKWLEIQSYGKHTPQFRVLDWMDTDNSEEHYSFGDYGREDDFENSIFYLLNQLDADPEFDMSIYDADGDGQIDNLVVLHSGYNSETFDIDCQTQREPEFGIWSHWRFTPDGWVSPTTGLTMNRYMVTSALDENCGSVPATQGIMVMNYLHSLGLDSLYDQGAGIGNGLGRFDVMAYPYGNRNDGLPGSLSSYSKLQLKWITPIEVEENKFVQLGPWGKQPDAIIISTKYSPGEYLLIENRQPVGVDDGFMGGGIAIYHVDEMQNGQSRASYPGMEEYPYDHYMVAVLPQDGKYELEKGQNLGDVGDLFGVGTTLGPGMNNAVFPNTDGYQFGYVWENGLTIHVKSHCGNPNAGRHMLLEITGFGDEASTGNSECIVEEKDSAVVERPDRPDRPSGGNGGGNGNDGQPEPAGPGVNAVTESPVEEAVADVTTMSPTSSNQFVQADVTAVPTEPVGEEKLVTMSPTMQLSTNENVESEDTASTSSPTAAMTEVDADIPEDGRLTPFVTSSPTAEVSSDAIEVTAGDTTNAPASTENVELDTPPENDETPVDEEPETLETNPPVLSPTEAPSDPSLPVAVVGEPMAESEVEFTSAEVETGDTATDEGYGEGGTIAAPERDDSAIGTDALLVIPTGDDLEAAPFAQDPPKSVDEVSVLDEESSTGGTSTETATTSRSAASVAFCHGSISIMVSSALGFFLL